MGRITTNVGLISGFPIQETVDKLISLQTRPRDLLKTQNQQFTNQQTAVTELSALLVSLKLTTSKLASADLYSQRTITSSKPDVLGATISGNPALGNYQFTPVRKVQTHQVISSRFASRTAPIGAGTFSVRFGGFVDPSAGLDLLNSGEGIVRGKIRITDRSGASTVIDLTFARTVDDVLTAINTNRVVNVMAKTDGDSFVLVDNTGLTASNLKVEEVGGTTAASLGLAGINAASSQATGADVISLFNDLKLDQLNHGHGIRFDDVLGDFQVAFRDGTERTVDFHRLAIAGTKARATTSAANGVNAQVTFTAVNAGSAFEGVNISFEDNPAINAGTETVVFDQQAKTLTFQIDSGGTTADHVIAALGRNQTAAAAFTATRATGSNGSGLLDYSDWAFTAGPPAVATTPGTASTEGRVVFTAVNGGPDYDNVTISFVDNPSITAGQETVVYDDSNPNNKTLIFQIDAGNTNANQIVAALASSAAGQIFTAAKASGSTGLGVVSINDTVVTSGGAIIEPVSATNELTVGDVLATLNALDPTRLQASIAPDGDRILLTDLSINNGGTFGVQSLNDSYAVEDLGIASAASGNSITGKRLLPGLQTSLLSRLAGGAGLDDLGLLSLTDRSGASAVVDLSGTETLQEVVAAIDAANIGISARINNAHNGIFVEDTTGSTSQNLLIANGDGQTNTAGRLGISVNAAVSSVNGGSLNLQTVSENMYLASLNGGAGVAKGTVKITDSLGTTKVLNVTEGLVTVRDLLDEIGRLGLALEARINDTGDGIALVDTTGVNAAPIVAGGVGTTGNDLHLLGAAVQLDVGGQQRWAIDGSSTLKIALDADDSLDDLVGQLNSASARVAASVVSDGTSVKPFRFTLTSQISGIAGALLIDASQFGFTLEEAEKPQDALLLLGDANQPGGILASSSTNKFNSLLSGATLEVKEVSSTPVSVAVGATDTTLVATLQAVVDTINRLNTRVKELTAYDAEADKRAVLQGDGAVLRVETEVFQLLSGRFSGAGSVRSIEELGISFNDDGSVEFNAEKFRERQAADPGAVQEFFSNEEFGFSAKIEKLTDQLADGDDSLLANRSQALIRKIEAANNKIAFYDERLEKSRERLLRQFQQMEIAIARIQSSLSSIDSLVPLPPL